MLGERRAHGSAARPVDGAARGDGAEPGGDGRDLGVVASGAAPGVEEDLLRQLIGTVHVPRAATGVGTDNGEVPLVELAVRIHVAGSGAGDECFIGIGRADEGHQGSPFRLAVPDLYTI